MRILKLQIYSSTNPHLSGTQVSTIYYHLIGHFLCSKLMSKISGSCSRSWRLKKLYHSSFWFISNFKMTDKVLLKCWKFISCLQSLSDKLRIGWVVGNDSPLIENPYKNLKQVIPTNVWSTDSGSCLYTTYWLPFLFSPWLVCAIQGMNTYYSHIFLLFYCNRWFRISWFPLN